MAAKPKSKKDQKAMVEVGNRLRTLVRYPYFAGLPSAKLHLLVQLCSEQVFRKDESILVEGEAAHSMYFIREGSAVALKGGLRGQKYGVGPDGVASSSLYVGAHATSFTQTMCAAKRRPPHMQKCLRRQNYSSIDRARDRAGLSSRQRQTEPCSAFRIDARRESSDLAR